MTSSYRLAKPKLTPIEALILVVAIYLLISGQSGVKVIALATLAIVLYNLTVPTVIQLRQDGVAIRGRIRCKLKYRSISSVKILDTPEGLFFPWKRSNTEIKLRRIHWLLTLPLPLPTKTVYLLLRLEDLDNFFEEVSRHLQA